MDELERAYLLSGEELLLLFSLLDSRPVVAFALPDPAQVPPAHWKQAGVGLCRKGLAAYTDAGLAPAEEIAGLIRACKGADTVCLAFCRDADCKTQALYWGGGQTVLLEGRIWPGYRLCAWAQDQDPGRWLDDCLGLPARVPARSPETVGDIEQLPPGLAWDESAVAWGAWESARVVLDVFRASHPVVRLVWLRGTSQNMVLCQGPAGARLQPDCQPVRETLKRWLFEGEKEAPYDPGGDFGSRVGQPV